MRVCEAYLKQLRRDSRMNPNFGPNHGTQNVLNIQPVIPFSLNSDYNVITRSILPVISMPSLGDGLNSTQGIGNLTITPSITCGLNDFTFNDLSVMDAS